MTSSSKKRLISRKENLQNGEAEWLELGSLYPTCRIEDYKFAPSWGRGGGGTGR